VGDFFVPEEMNNDCRKTMYAGTMVEFSPYCITGNFGSQTFKSTKWGWQSVKFIVLGIGLPVSFT